MKSVLPYLTSLMLFASCTTAYKAGQTPDDVYFSKARPIPERVRQNDEYVRADRNDNSYRYDEQTEDDRYLRMKVRNRRTWSDLDYYYSDPLAYNYNRYNTFYSPYYNTPWNYYSSWNYYYNPYNSYYNYNYYNPYGTKLIVVNSRPPVPNRPRTFNLNTYNPPAQNNNYGSKPSSGARRVYRSNDSYNTNNDRGNGLRSIFNDRNSSTQQNTTPVHTDRSSSPSATSTPSPSRSSSSTNAPARRF